MSAQKWMYQRSCHAILLIKVAKVGRWKYSASVVTCGVFRPLLQGKTTVRKQISGEIVTATEDCEGEAIGE